MGGNLQRVNLYSNEYKMGRNLLPLSHRKTSIHKTLQAKCNAAACSRCMRPHSNADNVVDLVYCWMHARRMHARPCPAVPENIVSLVADAPMSMNTQLVTLYRRCINLNRWNMLLEFVYLDSRHYLHFLEAVAFRVPPDDNVFYKARPANAFRSNMHILQYFHDLSGVKLTLLKEPIVNSRTAIRLRGKNVLHTGCVAKEMVILAGSVGQFCVQDMATLEREFAEEEEEEEEAHSQYKRELMNGIRKMLVQSKGPLSREMKWMRQVHYHLIGPQVDDLHYIMACWAYEIPVESTLLLLSSCELHARRRLAQVNTDQLSSTIQQTYAQCEEAGSVCRQKVLSQTIGAYPHMAHCNSAADVDVTHMYHDTFFILSPMYGRRRA